MELHLRLMTAMLAEIRRVIQQRKVGGTADRVRQHTWRKGEVTCERWGGVEGVLASRVGDANTGEKLCVEKIQCLR